MFVGWNTDFYSSHVIPLNEIISNYFVNWLLPSLFVNAKVMHLYLAPVQLKYYVLITFMTANMYQIWLHLSCRNVNLKICWTLYEREWSMFTELYLFGTPLKKSALVQASKDTITHTSKLKSILYWQSDHIDNWYLLIDDLNTNLGVDPHSSGVGPQGKNLIWWRS